MVQSKRIDNKHKVSCPECKNDIDLNEPTYEVGDVMECPYCGTTLEVAQVNGDILSIEVIEEEK